MDDSQGLRDGEWHQRYSQQARWTQDIRRYLFNKVSSKDGEKVLEIGSGTGAVLNQLAEEFPFSLTGVDINLPRLVFAKTNNSVFHQVGADGYQLPFPSDTFSASFCHYLLLWVEYPQKILMEMCRVTQSGGYIISLAEPDHEARIDYPPPLDRLGRLQTQALRGQGVDTSIGRKLRTLFLETGLEGVETGILGAQWTPEALRKVDQTEWMMIRSDLENRLSEKDFERYQGADRRARQEGKRVLFVPTFYASGVVP